MNRAALLVAFALCSLPLSSHAGGATRQAPGRVAPTAGVERALDKFAAANRDNKAALAAIEKAALQIKADPGTYIRPDGSVNMAAIGLAIDRQMGGAGKVALPAEPAGGERNGSSGDGAR